MKNLLASKLTLPIDVELVQAKFIYWSSVLNFNMESQTQSNWCWAATAKSVSHFQDDHVLSFSFLNPWTQCKIAGAELGQPCCNVPTPGVCNVPWYLDRALTRTNNFVSMQAGSISWDAVKAELAKGIVVGARIGWNGGGGHFMVIHGVSRIGTTKYLHIDDPIYGKSTLTYSQFATNYRGSGSWTHTYFTKKHFYFPMFKDIVVSPIFLKPIPDFRPLLHLQNPTISIDKPSAELELSLPHYSYVMKLSDIGEKTTLPKEAHALRVIESEKDYPIALYDLSIDDKNPEVLNAMTHPQQLSALDSAVEAMREATKALNDAVELRHLDIPALNIEALWAHTEKKNTSLFYIITAFERSASPMSEKDFFALLKARKEVVQKQDDTMGA